MIVPILGYVYLSGFASVVRREFFHHGREKSSGVLALVHMDVKASIQTADIRRRSSAVYGIRKLLIHMMAPGNLEIPAPSFFGNKHTDISQSDVE